MPDESGPKPKKKLTREEAQLQVLFETKLELYRRIFNQLEQEDPMRAAQIKPHYEEFIATEIEMRRIHPQGDYAPADVYQKLPNNLWVKYLKKFVETSIEIDPSRNEYEDIENFRRKVDKRMKGEDIH